MLSMDLQTGIVSINIKDRPDLMERAGGRVEGGEKAGGLAPQADEISERRQRNPL